VSLWQAAILADIPRKVEYHEATRRVACAAAGGDSHHAAARRVNASCLTYLPNIVFMETGTHIYGRAPTPAFLVSPIGAGFFNWALHDRTREARGGWARYESGIGASAPAGARGSQLAARVVVFLLVGYAPKPLATLNQLTMPWTFGPGGEPGGGGGPGGGWGGGSGGGSGTGACSSNSAIVVKAGRAAFASLSSKAT
jgi:hypothetical protein